MSGGKRPKIALGKELDVSDATLGDISRFMSKLVQQQVPGIDEPCWMWDAHTDKKGYGQFSYRGRMIGAHRFSYALFKGKIPDRMDVDHNKCHLHGCCNPSHVGLKTRVENGKDGRERQLGRPVAPF